MLDLCWKPEQEDILLRMVDICGGGHVFKGLPLGLQNNTVDFSN